MKISCGVYAELKTSAGNIFEHLHNTMFSIGIIVGLSDVPD